MSDIPRSSGILLHPTSLPGPHGVGEIGASARQFVDRLSDAGQSWWQILPLNPPGYGGSPYSADSAFAGNPYLIALEDLVDDGWLPRTDLDALTDAVGGEDPSRYDIGRVNRLRRELLVKAHANWEAEGRPRGADYDLFCQEEADWLDDFALFEAIKKDRAGADWRDWPDPLVERDKAALEEAKERLEDTVERIKFEQWVFDRQWTALRDYAADRGVRLIGDAPIFVAMDSADTWAHREIFKVDEHGEPEVVAGVPPDYFSETGQKWGNPLYNWRKLADSDYDWWLQRLERLKETVDLIRIDHFRGFDACWEVPAEAPTAEEGEWVDGPGGDFFDAVAEHFGELPFIAEDLGTITESVRQLRRDYELPGMKMMQFAFSGDPDHPFLPSNYPENCVAYTGTHDNDTTAGWYEEADESTRHQARTYLSASDDEVVWAMIESIMESDAKLCVFPVQDILELGSEARMNIPGTDKDNWNWRMTAEQLGADGWRRLGRLTQDTNRRGNR